MDKSTWINILLKQLEYSEEMSQDEDLRKEIVENPEAYREKLGIDSSLEIELIEEQENTYHIPIPYLEGNLQEEIEVPALAQPIVDFLVKAATDTSFRSELKESPCTILKENFPEITWWDTLDIKVVEDTSSKCHLIVTYSDENSELKEEELEMIAGGGSGSNLVTTACKRV